jgi:hypothetical protein
VGTNYEWAALVIQRVGVTPEQSDLDNFVRWMAAENPPSDWWHLQNPLNCGLNDGSADGTGSYPNLDFAATETAQVINQSNMAGIRASFVNHSNLLNFSAACAYSAWSTGGYHNHPLFIYSIPLPADIESGLPFPTTNPAPTPPPPPIPPLPVPVKEGTIVATPMPTQSAPNRVLVTAVGATAPGQTDRNNHLLVFTLNDPFNPEAPGYNVLDVTDGIGTSDPYLVQAAS